MNRITNIAREASGVLRHARVRGRAGRSSWANSISTQPQIFNLSLLIELAIRARHYYAEATPFPHLVITHAGHANAVAACAKAFPTSNDPRWFTYPATDHTQHNKQVMCDVRKIPLPVLSVISELHSEGFLAFLEMLTGVPGLVPDPTLYGGGMHQTSDGGRLDVHVDHDFNPNLQLFRRVSVLLYLSPWRAEYGGHLELWEGYRNREDNLVRCAKSIVPNFNTMVIFTNSETSYHGHPTPISCPPNLMRKSLAIYYCSTERHPSYSRTEHHRARFVRLPGRPSDSACERLYRERAAL